MNEKYKVGDKVLVESEIVKVDLVDNTYKVQVDNGNYHWVTMDSLYPYETDSDVKTNYMEEAWELARRIVFPVKEGGLTSKELVEIFDTDDPSNILADPVVEVAKKVKSWEETKTKFSVGDVVIWNDTNVLITHVYKELMDGICEDGEPVTLLSKDIVKTDNYIDLESLFKEIGE